MAGVSADGERSLDEDVSEVPLSDVCHLSSVVSCGPVDQCPVVLSSTAVDQCPVVLSSTAVDQGPALPATSALMLALPCECAVPREACQLMLNLSMIWFLVMQYDFRFLALFSCFRLKLLLFFLFSNLSRVAMSGLNV
jgi:hypothetical protein